MTSIVLHSTSGPDGKLHLEVPVGSPNTEFEVEGVVRAKEPGGILLPPGYFDLIGPSTMRRSSDPRKGS